MTRSKFLLLLLGATSIGGAALAWRQYGELVELRAAAMNREERAEWQRQVAHLEKLNREQRELFAAMRTSAGSEKVADAEVSRSREKRDDTNGAAVARDQSHVIKQQAAAIKELMDRPDVQSMLNVQKKAAFDQRYAGLYKQLSLPPEQLEKLKRLLEERASTMQDVNAAAREQGINLKENPDAYKRLVTEARNQINESIKATIGENGFEQLANFERTIPQRNLVSDLEQRLSYTNFPLNSAQSEQLVRILAANPSARPTPAATSAQPGSPGTSRADAGMIVRTAMNTVPGVGQLLGAADDTGRAAIPGYPISPSALSQAQAILSPAQMAALQQLQQQQQVQQQLKSLVTDTLVTSTPAPAPPAATRKGGG
jgi:hypothetical protein